MDRDEFMGKERLSCQEPVQDGGNRMSEWVLIAAGFAGGFIIGARWGYGVATKRALVELDKILNEMGRPYPKKDNETAEETKEV